MLVHVPAHKHVCSSGWTTAQKTAEKRLQCCQHEMYSPGRSGKRLLYEFHVQCKNLCLACTCREPGAQIALRAGYLHLEVIVLPKHTVPLDGKPEVSPKARFPSAGMTRVQRGAHALASAAPQSPPAATAPARRGLQVRVILNSKPCCPAMEL